MGPNNVPLRFYVYGKKEQIQHIKNKGHGDTIQILDMSTWIRQFKFNKLIYTIRLNKNIFIKKYYSFAFTIDM